MKGLRLAALGAALLTAASAWGRQPRKLKVYSLAPSTVDIDMDGVAISPDGRSVAVVGGKGPSFKVNGRDCYTNYIYLEIWDYRTQKMRLRAAPFMRRTVCQEDQTFPATLAERYVRYFDGGKEIVFSDGFSLHVVDAGTGKELIKPVFMSLGVPRFRPGHLGNGYRAIDDFSVARDADRLAVVIERGDFLRYVGDVRVYSLRRGKLIRSWPQPADVESAYVSLRPGGTSWFGGPTPSLMRCTFTTFPRAGIREGRILLRNS
jgi:hypothetical protein